MKTYANRLTLSAPLCQLRPVAKGVLEVKPPERFSGKGDWKVWDYISGINVPKCIISTLKPDKLQSVAKRLMILSLFFYLYKI